MPLARWLWNYLPFTSYVIQPSVDGTAAAAMSASSVSAPSVDAHLNAPNPFAGARGRMFGGDFYDRIHISTSAIDLGMVISQQQITLRVWNAWRSARTLTSLGLSNADGVTISGQPSPPIVFSPLQERTYMLTVSQDGPAVLDAEISWSFADGSTLKLNLAGQRVTAWTWNPDWQQGMLERLEWLTDVLQAYRGEEQRRALRLGPRQSLEFGVTVEGDERRHMESVLWNWGARVLAVPLWFDGLELAASLPAGSSTIPLDPGGRQFAAGDLVMLLGRTSREYEVLRVNAVGANIALVNPTTVTWPAGTRVYPARPARIMGDASLPRFTGAVASARLIFEMTSPANWTASAGATTYRGRPVFEDAPTWTEDPQLTMERKGELLDAMTGLTVFEDEARMPIPSQSGRWLLQDRAQVNAWRARLFALRGKQGSIWVPSWTDDLQVKATIASNSLSIDVGWIGYTKYLADDPSRRDIRIELTNGTVFYRRVTGAAEVDANTERLSIDAQLGVTVTTAQIALVSFLMLMRQSSDSAEIAWFTGDAAEASATFRGFRS